MASSAGSHRRCPVGPAIGLLWLAAIGVGAAPPQDPSPLAVAGTLAGGRAHSRRTPRAALPRRYRWERSHCSRSPMSRRQYPRPARGRGPSPRRSRCRPARWSSRSTWPTPCAWRAARPGHRHRPGAGLAVPGPVGSGPRAVAAEPLHRADLLSRRWADPDDHRPGPDDRPRLVVPRHDGHHGQQFPAPPPGTGSPPEQPEWGAANLRRDLRGPGRAAGHRGEPGRGPGRDQQCPAGGRRRVLRPPAGRRDACHRARGRRQCPGPGGHHGDVRPVRGGPGS